MPIRRETPRRKSGALRGCGSTACHPICLARTTSAPYDCSLALASGALLPPASHCLPPFIAIPAAAFYPPRMNTIRVGSDKEAQLGQRMAVLGVREADIEETFVRSGGHGGQNVNKTATCVVLLHRPTGLQVKCQITRQQGLNRFLARRLLLDKIERRRTGRGEAERARIEKIRRQKRRRSRRAKERLLADKSHHAAKKDARRRVMLD